MPSPFPGMDPWLEDPDLFPDLHDRFILGLSDALNAAMPPGYVSITRMIVWTEKAQRRGPDVSLFGRRPQASGVRRYSPRRGCTPWANALRASDVKNRTWK